MNRMTRRGLLAGLGGAGAMLAGCGNPIGGPGPEILDARVDAMRDFLFQRYPGTRDLEQRAHGVLYMPLVTEGALFLGGAHGRGALRIGGATVDYFSATRASVGVQIGAQQYAHALFFMTREALADFRASDGWAISADVRYATPEGGAAAGMDTITRQAPIIALVFGQAGLIAGASLSGVRYARIVP
ncbi:MAG: lipid-binding SYLF domain-containing protein [Alkalilacustris sp.]